MKMQDLRPGTSGHNLVVKVVSAKQVLQKSRSDAPQRAPLRLSECIVGDDTAVIIFPARNEQGCKGNNYGVETLKNSRSQIHHKKF